MATSYTQGYSYKCTCINGFEGDGVNQYLDTTVTKFMAQQEDDIAITKYLGTSSAKFLEAAKESAKLNDAT